MENNKIVIGRFGAAHGIKGWIKIISFTDPIKNIINLFPWYIKQNNNWQQITIDKWQVNHNSIIVKLANINDRETAKIYTNLDIAIKRDQLPQLPIDEYYWADLQGLTVINKQGETLGIVDQLIATGSNDVFVVKDQKNKKYLIPYLDNVVLDINLHNKTITVDWHEI